MSPTTNESFAETSQGEVADHGTTKETSSQPKHVQTADGDDNDTAAAAADDVASPPVPVPTDTTPPCILEKGLLYLFPRASAPHTLMILRPLARYPESTTQPAPSSSDHHHRRTTEDDDGGAKLIAVYGNPPIGNPGEGGGGLPASWTARVRDSGADFADLRDRFLRGETAVSSDGGERKGDAAPAAEGLYALTAPGFTHNRRLEYLVTLPADLDDGRVVQGQDQATNALRLERRGRFDVATRNPRFPISLSPQVAEYPEE